MEATSGAPPQRVCPSCARISWAAGPRCPYCRERFRRRSTTTLAWMLAVAVAVVLVGVGVMLLIFAHELRSELNDRADKIQRELDASVAQLRKDVDARLSAIPSATPTPFPTPTPTPSPAPSPSPTPKASPTQSPRATATPTLQP